MSYNTTPGNGFNNKHYSKPHKCNQTKKFNFWKTAAYIPRKENLEADV